MLETIPIFPNIPHYTLKDLIGKTLVITELICESEDSKIIVGIDSPTGVMYVISVTVPLPHIDRLVEDANDPTM